jgi:hypothetical protein
VEDARYSSQIAWTVWDRRTWRCTRCGSRAGRRRGRDPGTS